MQNDTDLFGTMQIVSVSWLSSKKKELSSKLWMQDWFRNQNIGSIISCLGTAVNKGHQEN